TRVPNYINHTLNPSPGCLFRHSHHLRSKSCRTKPRRILYLGHHAGLCCIRSKKPRSISFNCALTPNSTLPTFVSSTHSPAPSRSSPITRSEDSGLFAKTSLHLSTASTGTRNTVALSPATFSSATLTTPANNNGSSFVSRCKTRAAIASASFTTSASTPAKYLARSRTKSAQVLKTALRSSAIMASNSCCHSMRASALASLRAICRSTDLCSSCDRNRRSSAATSSFSSTSVWSLATSATISGRPSSENSNRDTSRTAPPNN